MNKRTQPFRLNELAEESGLAYITIWRAVKAGEIASTRVGRTILIPTKEAHRLIYGEEK